MGVILAVPLAAILLKEPLKLIHIICLVISFKGGIIMVEPDIIFGNTDNTNFSLFEYFGMLFLVLQVSLDFNCYGLLKEIPSEICLLCDASFSGLTFIILYIALSLLDHRKNKNR
eukprot:UN14429